MEFIGDLFILTRIMLGLLSPGSAKADVFFKSTPLTKLSPYKGKKPEIEKNLSQKLGEPEPKTGESCSRFRFQIWRD